MKRDLELVTGWLLQASEQVPAEYIQVPVAGFKEPAYRERVYCYELYHRWRCHWAAGFPFSLSGEVDKQGHPLIREGPKPDFLVHVPGRMSNLLVVEVKSKNSAVDKMRDDLEKLTRFRRDLSPGHVNAGNYHAAYFWVYGLSSEDWPTFREELLGAKPPVGFDPALVTCFLHEGAGRKALQVAWE